MELRMEPSLRAKPAYNSHRGREQGDM
jgi:hypothetical protein